jgi:peptidoglycan/LPS O-acetylase OafA/YrhL
MQYPSSLPRAPRYETLTLWRGIACLFVVVFHSVNTGYGLALPGGSDPLGPVLAVIQRLWIGVPLFFVISGYCVTASADAARRSSKPGLSFFWRRFRRIYPPYWTWLAVCAIFVFLAELRHPGFFGRAFVPNPATFTPAQWLGNITLTETWRWHLLPSVETELLSPSWTLCYEEQFYALVGLTLVFARRHFFGVLAGITVLVIAGLFILPRLGVSTLGLFLDGKWLMFGAGVLVYFILNYASKTATAWFCIPLVFGALCAAANPQNLLLARVNEPNQSYLAAFCFALLLIPLHRWDAHLCQAKVMRPLMFCGEMCYSLYLIHWPVVTVVSWAFNQLEFQNPFAVLFLGLPSCLLVALALSWGFHMLIERKFWNPRYSTAPRDAGPPSGAM